MANKGRRYELNVCKELNSAHDEIVAYPAGYSGNQYGPSPDILITTPSGAYALELKKLNFKKGERRTVLKGDEIENLIKCKNSYTDVFIVISISNRKTLMVGFDFEYDNPIQSLEDHIHDAFDPSVTKNNNLRLTKPETSKWSSKRKQEKEDWELILDKIALHNKIKNV